MTPDLAQLLQDPTQVAEIPAEAIPGLLGELERLKASLWARLVALAVNGRPEAPADGDRLLTAEQVAERLQIPKGRVYEMARQGEIPTARFGKYVRVPVSALQQWVEKHLDRPVSTVYSPSKHARRHDRQGTAANPRPARAHPGSAGGSARRIAQHCRTVGAGRGADPRGDGPADPTPGEDRAEGNP